MKTNNQKNIFIVSGLTKSIFLKKNINRFIFFDDFTKINFEKSEKLKNYYESNLADDEKIVLDNAHSFLIKNIFPKLNNFHKRNYNEKTWELFFGVELHFYVHRMYSLYRKFKEKFDSEDLEFYHLSKDSYYTPLSFSELRLYANHDHFKEMVFSIYVNDILKIVGKNDNHFFNDFIPINNKKSNNLKLFIRRILNKFYTFNGNRVSSLWAGVYFNKILKAKVIMRFAFRGYFYDFFDFKNESKTCINTRNHLF